MVTFMLIVVVIMYLIQTFWKNRRILMLSRKLKNKYRALPIIGHSLLFAGTGEDLMKGYQKLGREAIKSKYGITSFWLGPTYFTVICDPIVAAVVSKASLGKSELAEKFATPLIGNGSVFAPVHVWRPRRNILAPTFSPKYFNGFVQTFVEQSLITIRLLKSKAGEGTFSIWNDITSYTVNSICETALGTEINAHPKSRRQFLSSFEEYSELLAYHIVRPWLHWDFVYQLLPVYREAEKHRKIIHDFIDNVIRKKRMLLINSHSDNIEDENLDINSTRQNSPQKQNILDLLLTSSDETAGLSDIEIREELTVLLLAGTDTSAVGICFTIVMLSRYLSIQERVYEEIREIFGDSDRAVSFEDLPKMKYLNAVIRETLRLYPPVPFGIRKNDRDIVLNSEITLPAGSYDCLNIWGLHRNTQYWGADAEEFNPDRFLNGTVTPGSAFMAFSYGPRNCLGYNHAMLSMKVMITTLLRNYKVLPSSDVSPEDLKKPLRLELRIMLKDADNFKVRLEHRK